MSNVYKNFLVTLITLYNVVSFHSEIDNNSFFSINNKSKLCINKVL